MTAPTYAQLAGYRRAHGLPWFRHGWDLNLLICRSEEIGTYDDLVAVACIDDAGREFVRCYPATGEAGAAVYLKPSHPDGTVYVLDQHVPGGLELGLHKDRSALRQRRSFAYVRWPADGTVPTPAMLAARAEDGHQFDDIRYTNVHNRAGDRSPAVVNRDSEGCTVILYQCDHASLLELVRIQRARRGSAVVSPTYCRLSDVLALPKE